MAAVERDRARRPVAPAVRWAAGILAVIAAGAAQWVMVANQALLRPVDGVAATALGYLAHAAMLVRIAENLVEVLITRPMMAPALLICGCAMAAVWAGTLAGFRLILQTDNGRSFT
jgi:hypothetical protein